MPISIYYSVGYYTLLRPQLYKIYEIKIITITLQIICNIIWAGSSMGYK